MLRLICPELLTLVCTLNWLLIEDLTTESCVLCEYDIIYESLLYLSRVMKCPCRTTCLFLSRTNNTALRFEGESSLSVCREPHSTWTQLVQSFVCCVSVRHLIKIRSKHHLGMPPISLLGLASRSHNWLILKQLTAYVIRMCSLCSIYLRTLKPATEFSFWRKHYVCVVKILIVPKCQTIRNRNMRAPYQLESVVVYLDSYGKLCW